MAQPSVAREPSMEEILASIRRIIESNEPVADSAARSEFDDYSEDDRVSDEASDLAFAPEMAANDAGAPSSRETSPLSRAPDFSAQPAATAAAVPERSLSLADVAARVRAASGRAPEMPSETVEPVPPRPVASAAPQPLPRPVLPPIPELGIAGFDPNRSVDEPKAMPRLVEAAQEEARPAAPVVEPVAVDVQPEVKIAEPAAEQKADTLPAKIEAAASLMSAEAGAQVARSFGELADMLDGFNQQSVEEIAQDMLRPMLQEWLDDNLPTLVERLVREEIERVARGPRR